MSLTYVSEQLLTSNDLSYQNLQDILASLTEQHLDYADMYFQSICHEEWTLEDSIIKKGFYNIDQGVGIRVIHGDKTGFAYANEITLQALQKSAHLAQSIIKQNGQGKLCILNKVDFTHLYHSIDPLRTMNQEEKIALLRHVEQTARAEDPRIQQVDVTLSGIYEQMLIIATDGTLAADIRPLVRLSVSVLAEHDGKRERANSGGGGRYGYEYFCKTVHGDTMAEYYARDAVRIALINLSAIDAPAGAMPVVLGAGWPGVLLHEAVGHCLEGDFNRRETSIFSGKIGQQVASSLCTIVDDATLFGYRGSLSVDDEGVPGQCTVLIKNGILKGYMQDKMNARLMGMVSTGNGRRESYAHLPMPRMTNTYMLAGESTTEEIIDSIKYGIYAINFSGGQVDITSGKFVFSTAEAYLIKNGKIKNAIKGATLIGSGEETMKQISMVGNNLKLDSGIGVCDKDGQSIPVCVGQPTLKINRITVGGTV